MSGVLKYLHPNTMFYEQITERAVYTMSLPFAYRNEGNNKCRRYL